MRFYHSSFNRRIQLNSKRNVKILPDSDEKGLFHDDYDDAVWDDSGLEPYVPPTTHVHHRRKHMHLYHKVHSSYDRKLNATSHSPDLGSVIFKRADSDDEKEPDTASSSSFTGS
jgi:hypothetical protein